MHNMELFDGLELRGRYPETDAIDLRLLATHFRRIESGRTSSAGSLGAKGWDFLADVVNSYTNAKDPEDKILPWDKDIHPRFMTFSSDDRRAQAAERLAAKYTKAKQ